MHKRSTSLLLPALAAAALITFPLTAQATEDFNCDEHAKHLDHEIGAEKALEAYHVLHGDNGDEHHVVEELKKDHPDIEHELEDYAAKGCTEAELEAHTHDDDGHH